MSGRLLIRIGVIVAALALVCVFALLRSGEPTYEERHISVDSEEVQESLDILRRIAADPRTVPALMSADAGPQAQPRVAAAAAQMSSASSLDFKSAAWFGEYLRVGVTCSMPGDRLIEKHFFFKREGTGLRITGPAL
jgi:hypothetical protein